MLLLVALVPQVAAGHDGQAVAALERAELACISSHLGSQLVLRWIW